MDHCSICLETTKDPFQSKCSHTFCNKCIMEWITQHDECPLCRNPISETPTIVSYDDDEDEPMFIIDINENTLSNEEKKEVYDRVTDFIETLDTELSIYKWIENKEGSWYTTIRKQKYVIDMKIDIVNIGYIGFHNYYKIYVGLHKRDFVKPKYYKYRNKQFKLDKPRNKSYFIR